MNVDDFGDGTVSASVSRRSLLRAGVALGAGATIAVPFGLWGAGEADAATSILSCSDWGARAPSSPVSVLGGGPNKIIVHHTASPNSTDLSLAHAFSLARGIQNDHMDNRGFIDTGQHFTITRGGFVLEGRHRSLERLRAGAGQVVGAHCVGQNDQAIGIENEGTYTSVVPPALLYDQLVTLCAEICSRYGIGPSQIFGHRDFNSTECPGDVLYGRLPRLRSDVAGRMRSWPTARRGDTGERVRTVQYLLRASGQSLAVDGSFGSGTEAAVGAFQRARGLPETLVVTSATWEPLVVTVRSGSTGDPVTALQSQLNTRGYGLGLDGSFGARTDAAVRDFQSRNGLTVDGIVGPNTWNRLV